MPLRRLFPDNQPMGDTAKIDIIAIHGLNPRSKSDTAHAWDTWRTPDGPSGRFWLREDLPKHLPDARIFLYEYKATAVYGRDRDNFIDKADELLEAIRIERVDVETRPIIFISHSMGGLLVKQALINAHNNQKYMPTKRATRGLAFFATPHNGGDWKLISLGKLTSKIARRAGYQKGDDVLEVLKSGSLFSDLMREHWRHQLLEYDVVSFWGGLDNIVPRESARLGLPGNRENIVKLNTNHSGICKFGMAQTSQDNLKLARQNIKDLYCKALQPLKLSGLPSEASKEALVPQDQLSERLSRMQADGNPRGSDQPSTPQYHVPFLQNRKFTGRNSILEELQRKFFIDQECQKLAIFGLGGIGKTQVALQFAYWVKENQPDYSIFWVPVLSHASLEQAYLEIGKKLGVPLNTEEEDPKESVRRHLSSDEAGRWLLVIDNADDMDMVLGSNGGTAGVEQYLPYSETGLILFTTRVIEVGLSVTGNNVLELPKMDMSEAIGLLEKSLVRKQLLQDTTLVSELLRELTYLPLAITQATAYLNRNRQLSIRRYLGLLRGTKADMVGLMSREFHDTTRYPGSSNAVATTWLVSFDQIQSADSVAAELLSFLSCIEPKAIPRSLIPTFHSTEEIEHAIGTLCEYSFLTAREDGEMYDMHSLVHLATKVWVEKTSRAEETTVKALRHFKAAFSSFDPANRNMWHSCLPHAFRILEGSESNREEERFDLFYLVGRCLYIDRRFKDSIRCHEEVVRWRETTLPETSADRLASEHALASAYLSDRRIPKAIKMLEHVASVQRKTLNERDHDRLASEHELARAYIYNRQIKEAIELFEHVVEVQKNVLEEECQDRLTSEQMLASAYSQDQRIPEAIKILEHVVELRKVTLEETDHERLKSIVLLSRAYLDDGQTSKAIYMLEQVVKIREVTLQEADHSRLNAEYELSRAYLAVRRISEAIELLEHVVEIRKETLEETDHERIKTTNLLARAYLERNMV